MTELDTAAANAEDNEDQDTLRKLEELNRLYANLQKKCENLS